MLALTACDNDIRHGLDQDPTVLPEGTAVEPWGIGDTWYDYEFQGPQAHTVSPKDISWVVIHPDGDAFHVAINGYYSDQGVGGFPRLLIRPWTGSEFGEAKQWEAEQSIREQSACIDFQSAEKISCTGAYDAIWRVDLRPVPEMGFSIGNPGFYLSTEHGEVVYRINGLEPPATLPTAESEEVERVRTIFDHDATPLLSLSLLTEDKSVIQLLASLMIAEWQVVENKEDNELLIQARCVPAEYEQKRTLPLDMAPESLTIDTLSLQTWTFIDLCGVTRTTEDIHDGEPAIRVIDERNELRVGQWKRNDHFTIALQKTEDGLRLWVSLDQPLEVRPTDAFETTTAPEGLWSIP